MPIRRTLTVTSTTPTLTTYTDPRTSRTILLSTLEDGTPTGVTVTDTPLVLRDDHVDPWTYTGYVDGGLWQLDVYGLVVPHTIRAITST
jgi:hypothetical protein